MADLPSASDAPPKFHGDLQPHTGREPNSSDSLVGPGEYVSVSVSFFSFIFVLACIKKYTFSTSPSTPLQHSILTFYSFHCFSLHFHFHSLLISTFDAILGTGRKYNWTSNIITTPKSTFIFIWTWWTIVRCKKISRRTQRIIHVSRSKIFSTFKRGLSIQF
jgi:hypothetical protein